MKQKRAIRINESQINSLLNGMLNESYKDKCKIVGMYAFVQFFKLHPEKLQTLEPKWKERYDELSKYFDEHPLGMEMQAIYRREWPQLQRKQTINEYNGSDAIEDAENSGYDEDDPMYQYILQNGGGGVLYEKQAKNMKKSKQVIKLNESRLRSLIKESIKRVLKEDFVEKEELATKFLSWATSGESDRQSRIGGPINALQAMYEYYYDNNDDYLYRAAETFSEVSGNDVNDVFEAAKMAANHYFYYNPINESKLRNIIKESIKKVLKENNTNTINALSTEIGCSPQNIYRDETHPYRYFVKGMDGDRDVEYLVFDNEEQAKEYALHIFDAEGAAPLDYYIQNAKLAGANMEILFPNGKPNWKKIEEFIVDTCGPEWVLAGYDGEPIALENGQIAYRWD